MANGPSDYRSRVFRRYFDTLSTELGFAGPDSPGVPDAVFRSYFLPLIPADRGARILDVGCGRGHLLDFLKRSGYRDLQGVDLSPQMVECSRRLGVPAEQSEATAFLSAHPARFDCVLALDVLEHLFKDELFALMDAVFSALRPGGCFIAHTVNADGLAWGRMRYIDITHEQSFTRYSLGQLFTVTGFSGQEFRPVEPVGSGPRVLARRLIGKGVRLAASLVHHAESGSGILNNDHIVTSSFIAKAVKAAA